jgi:hypothetical protein
MISTITLVILAVYGTLLGVLWVMAMIHAASTPHEEWSRRALWIVAIAVNPSATIWYWYMWKRWAFWVLFAPYFLFAAFLPFTLEETVRSLATRDISDKFVHITQQILANVIDAIPLSALIPLVAFPFVLRLAALMHLGGNTKLSASDRNDRAVTFALPIVGFGSALTYSLTWRRGWAAAGFLWFLLASAVVWSFVRYL